jgi:hypothetical protein
MPVKQPVAEPQNQRDHHSFGSEGFSAGFHLGEPESLNVAVVVDQPLIEAVRAVDFVVAAEPTLRPLGVACFSEKAIFRRPRRLADIPALWVAFDAKAVDVIAHAARFAAAASINSCGVA